MDYVKPTELIVDILETAKVKAGLSVSSLLIRGVLAGAFLGFATSLVLVVLAQRLPPILGAVIFPVGFVMLVLLGLELATGNFALLPQAFIAGKINISQILRNWGWVFLGNALGSLLYAFLFYLAFSAFGSNDPGPIATQVVDIAQKKTLFYKALGLSGWGAAFIKGILCNWLVTLGAVLAFSSRSTLGKIAAMWLPIMTFFALGLEHSIVNLFVIPTGILFGAPVSFSDWWWWNQIPVTLGNILGGAIFTGIGLSLAYWPLIRRPSLTSGEIRQPRNIKNISFKLLWRR